MSDLILKNIIKVAIFSYKRASGISKLIEQLEYYSDIKVDRINNRQINNGYLKNYDVVIFTGGRGSNQAKKLGKRGCQEVKKFVKNGGGYIGICAGAYLACSCFDWGIGLINAKTIGEWNRGKGRVKIEPTKIGSNITSLPLKSQNIYYHNGPIIEPDNKDNLPNYKTIAFFKTDIDKNLENSMIDTPAMVISNFGKGRVFISSPHPEQTKNMEDLIPSIVDWIANE